MITFLNGIININSMSGIETKKLRSLYASTKWGLKGFSGCLKKEYDKINILDVYPSSIKTNSTIINGMEISYVVDSIYNNYYKNINELILDGRKENV
jgi:short-subunit dehydrogenase